MPGQWLYTDGVLSCEGADLSRIASSYGTPAYVYSKAAIREKFRAYRDALTGVPHRICYSVKANSNIGLLNLLAREGAGFDIVSGGELYRVLAAGGDPAAVAFSGVAKTPAEIRFALSKGIHSFNCESDFELHQISQAAVALDRVAAVAVRVNPDVNALTHPYISTGLRSHKFGVDISTAPDLYRRAALLPGLRLEGVSCHIGSQIMDPEPLLEAADRVLDLISRLRADGHTIRYADLGGGLGVAYRPNEESPPIPSFIAELVRRIAQCSLTLLVEPGRSIVADAGILLTRVLLVKESYGKRFAIVDAGMNDLVRPALYQAHHEIVPVNEPSSQATQAVDVVGPVCESGDFFARDRALPQLKAGDLLAIQTAGAYGFVQAGNYNSRPRPCELLVDSGTISVIRRRETYEDLVRGESIPAEPPLAYEI